MCRRAFAPLIALFLFLSACTPKTQPAQIFPGFESAPPDSLATIRESDRVYFLKFDGKEAKKSGSSLLGRDTDYRQYQVPAGQHDIVVYYDNGESNPPPGLGLTLTLNLGARPGSLGLPDITMPVNLLPGHTYSFTSGVSKFYLK